MILMLHIDAMLYNDSPFFVQCELPLGPAVGSCVGGLCFPIVPFASIPSMREVRLGSCLSALVSVVQDLCLSSQL